MKEIAVYQQEQEMERLSVQEELFLHYEQPVYQKIFARPRRFVLDIGSNDGRKTVKRFADLHTQKVIGLECNSELTKTAMANCRDSRFSFFTCDVEDENFMSFIRQIMAEEDIPAFDVIHISFVLMHLQDCALLLEKLRPLLAADGVLMVIDVNDDETNVLPDKRNLFSEFKELLCFDPYAGDRRCGAKLPELLSGSGYKDMSIEREKLVISPAEAQKKQNMFDVFCSYLEEDIKILLRDEPENQYYIRCADWLKHNYEAMRDDVLARDSIFTIGVRIITCTGGLL